MLLVPDIDDRNYRFITLSNGLDVMLISDPKVDRAAAAMDVNVGYLADPPSLPGLAHFLEHLLFLGTRKYPSENDYAQYLNENGGFSNAYTDAQNTNFYFEIAAGALDETVLEPALDRFAQFFVDPLFDASCTERERLAVDSEHTKNIQNDDWRVQQLERDLSAEGHVFRKFGTGNLTTLKTKPESEGIDTREACIQFYNAHYSSNIMKLAVLGKESLDVLEKWVVPRFSAIKNKSITPETFPVNPLGASELGKLIRMKPVKEAQTLMLTFPWPDTTDIYRKAPNKYLCHLIGHESNGSILSCLKEVGLASSLRCYVSHGAKGFDFFKIEIDLSDQGVQEWENVVYIFFQYVEMLKKSEPCKWIYDEVSVMSHLSFKYQEKIDPSSYCSSISVCMQLYKEHDVLIGPYLMEDFDAQLIKDLTATLSISRFRAILIASPENGTDGWLNAPWYGTEYCVFDLPSGLMDRLANIEQNHELHLPKENPFIPQSFFVTPENSEDVFEHPLIIKDTPTTRLWFLLDNKFKVPRTGVTLIIKSPLVYASPRLSVIAALYCELVMEALNEMTYMAETADLSCNMQTAVEGIVLAFGGYSDKLEFFVQSVTATMANFKIDPNRFTVVKEDMTRSHMNFDTENPDYHASYFLSWMLQERLWTDQEKLRELDSITLDDICTFYPLFLNPAHIETLTHGTFDREAALRLASIVESTLSPSIRPLPVSSRFTTTRTRIIPPLTDVTYRRLLPNVENTNNAVLLYFQFGAASRETSAKTLLLDQIVGEPFFDTLRTKEQLGYVVWSGARFSTGISGLQFAIQSGKSPREIEERILAFLEENVPDLLAKMTNEEFQKHCGTVAMRLKEKPKFLIASSQLFWNEITEGTYDFDRLEEISEKLLTGITKDNLIDFYENFVRAEGKGRAKLSIQVWSHQSFKNIGEFADGTHQSSGDRLIVTSDSHVSELRNKWHLCSSGSTVRSIESLYAPRVLLEGQNEGL
ncbi:Insulinase (Peptidase M16) [Entophlyctis sp. JEL0112]|nr:Insulinase (Peptidase M16) [Entophlyctis sp. JEL0112]